MKNYSEIRFFKFVLKSIYWRFYNSEIVIITYQSHLLILIQDLNVMNETTTLTT